MTGVANTPELNRYFQAGKKRTYHKGEIIIYGGDRPQGVYMISTGYIKVYTLADRAEENLHVIYGAGEVFPLIWAIKDDRREVFYEALSDTEVWQVDRDILTRDLQADAVLSYQLLQQTVRQFHVYADRLDNLQYQNAYDRVVYRLLFLASRFGRRHGKGYVIQAPLTHQHIASSINLSRETVSREIEKLEGDGLISYEEHRIVIHEIARLADCLEDMNSLESWGL